MSGFPTTRRANPAAPWHHVDTTLMAAVVGIASLGMLMVYSATHKKLEDAGLDPGGYVKKQALFVLLGVGVMILVASLDYRVYRDFAPVIYVGGITLLLFVLTPLGSTVRGSQSWYQLGPLQLQPSELAKIMVIVCGSTYAAFTAASWMDDGSPSSWPLSAGRWPPSTSNPTSEPHSSLSPS